MLAPECIGRARVTAVGLGIRLEGSGGARGAGGGEQLRATDVDVLCGDGVRCGVAWEAIFLPKWTDADVAAMQGRRETQPKKNLWGENDP